MVLRLTVEGRLIRDFNSAFKTEIKPTKMPSVTLSRSILYSLTCLQS